MFPNKQQPSFRIYNERKQRVATLIHCFIKEYAFNKEMYLSLKSLRLGSNEEYTPVWDESTHLPIAELGKQEALHCLVSFQKHTYGNFAVIKAMETEHV